MGWPRSSLACREKGVQNMKAFEEWYIELSTREEDCSLETQAKYKKGWEAALRWIHEYHCRGSWDDGSDLQTAIREELGVKEVI